MRTGAYVLIVGASQWFLGGDGADLEAGRGVELICRCQDSDERATHAKDAPIGHADHIFVLSCSQGRVRIRCSEIASPVGSAFELPRVQNLDLSRRIAAILLQCRWSRRD